MKVLVTGGAGFIGSHVVDLLVESGHDVLVVDDLSSGLKANVNPRARLEIEAVESPRLAGVFQDFAPDCVVHCAAQTSVAVSWREAQKDATVNISGSVNVISNCLRCDTRRVIYCSSAAVYGNPITVLLDENHPTNPISPYGISKLAVEHYLRAYSLNNGLGFAALRFANVYGPRQKAELEGGVIAIFLEQLAVGRTPVVYGDGTQTRDFVFVGDVARAVVEAANSTKNFVANVSTGSEISVNGLLELLARRTGLDFKPEYGPPRSGDIKRSCLDNSRIKSLLGWTPRTGLDEGLRITWDHVRGVREEVVT